MPRTTSRNAFITHWALPSTEDYMKTTCSSLNSINPSTNLIHIQDDLELFDDSLPCLYQVDSPGQLEPTFQSPVAFQFASPLSSPSASPDISSPAPLSPPTTTDFSAVWEDAWAAAPSMSASSSCNPSIKVDQSSPPLRPSQPFSSQALPATSASMLVQHGLIPTAHGWSSDSNIHLLSPVKAQNALTRRTSGLNTTHRRTQSGSPGTSGANRSSHTYDQRNSSGGKSLPTPVQTPVQTSFLAAAFQNGDNAEMERAMRQAVFENHHRPADDDPFNYPSLPPSVSSMSYQNSPMTPQTSYEDLDDGSRSIAHGEDRYFPTVDQWMNDYLQLDTISDFAHPQTHAVPMGVPKLNRTISDVYQDELYNPAIVLSSPASKPQNSTAAPTPLPYRTVFADRLHAAKQGHLTASSQSPSNSIHRERSPFRQGSDLASALAATVPGLPPNMQLTHTPIDLGSQRDIQGEPKTISPRDALLEYHDAPEDVAMPSLFPTASPECSYQMMSEQPLDLRRASSSTFHSTANYSQIESFPNRYATHQAMDLHQPFYVPQPQQPVSVTLNSRRGPASNSLIHPMPEFPVSVPSMESSTASETREPIHRPSDTSSDSGTYTCTYHGCSLRFETPAKLQKHKREAHRQTMAGQLASRSPSERSISLRNSQAGPHKCERINPSTGKPCNSIFSRPYDLTRHEDTIHNARKQKVRCHLCQEEKTFSRNDALTRHMRVVHPEIDWPGKQRRKTRV
jgi:hypothetical protein